MGRIAALETLAAVCGMAGAFVIAFPAVQGWGFALFLISNLGWIAFSASHAHWKMFAQQLVFTACSLLGLWNFFCITVKG